MIIDELKNNIYIILSLYLGYAAFMDVRFKKVSNIWIGLFFILGIAVYKLPFLVTTIIAFILLFILYLFGFIGGGDVKFLSVFCAYIGVKDMLVLSFISMLIASAYALYYLITKKIFISRMKYFINYVNYIFLHQKIVKYSMFDNTTEFMPLMHWFLLGFIVWRIIKLWIIFV